MLGNEDVITEMVTITLISVNKALLYIILIFNETSIFYDDTKLEQIAIRRPIVFFNPSGG